MYWQDVEASSLITSFVWLVRFVRMVLGSCLRIQQMIANEADASPEQMCTVPGHSRDPALTPIPLRLCISFIASFALHCLSTVL